MEEKERENLTRKVIDHFREDMGIVGLFTRYLDVSIPMGALMVHTINHRKQDYYDDKGAFVYVHIGIELPKERGYISIPGNVENFGGFNSSRTMIDGIRLLSELNYWAKRHAEKEQVSCEGPRVRANLLKEDVMNCGFSALYFLDLERFKEGKGCNRTVY